MQMTWINFQYKNSKVLLLLFNFTKKIILILNLNYIFINLKFVHDIIR